MTTAELLRPLLERGMIQGRSELIEALLALEQRGYVASAYGPASELTFTITAEGRNVQRAGLTLVQVAVLEALRVEVGKPPGRRIRKSKE